MKLHDHPPPAVFKLGLGLVVGVLVAVLLPPSLTWWARVLLGWVAFCATVLVWLRWLLWHSSPERMRQLATREDDTRAVAGGLTVLTTLISLVGVGFLLHEANKPLPGGADNPAALALTGLAVMTVAASWLLLHSEYALHYAHRYYSDGGGIAFLDGDGRLDDPDYRDFAYLAFVLGMTFQVSDTNITSRRMRRLVLGHSMLSYVFGTVIVAVTINGVASLIGK